MKNLFIAAIWTVFLFASNSFSQACGGSFLHLELVNSQTRETIQNADYRLYYVYPKIGKRPETNEIIAAAAKFYHGEESENRGHFYKIYEGKFLQVEAAKAENFIAGYNAEDYKNSFNPWREDHEKQLQGSAKHGKIDFRASETDDTPFLLKIQSKGFEPVYLFSNFLGGCYHGATVKIEMKPEEKSERKKCLPIDKNEITEKLNTKIGGKPKK